MIEGELQLPKMAGREIRPNVFLIGEPRMVGGQLRCLADYYGALVLLELSLTLKAASA